MIVRSLLKDCDPGVRPDVDGKYNASIVISLTGQFPCMIHYS